MSPAPNINIHATAIVVATTGLLFVGPSGSGKSILAHACIAAAGRDGLFASLVSDDQVFVTLYHGRVIASRPESIADRMELRGSGIARVPSLARARMDYAILPGSLAGMQRLPDEGEQFEVLPDTLLPLVRVANTHPEPLAVLARFIPFLGFPV
nr:serine/threonine protein kinase [uncultured Gellertiella sp.]